ncbi:MAG TPA: preprotein translocase subunit SecE [Solirubrobacteraceae bacterium]|nr:preprotein translocase subunit SecE [Solirubrobacteraceae bacterium]
MARDRKRAKQRRERAGRSPGASARSAQATTPSQPAREDLPGALDHASGEVDEFDAALVRGAGGMPAAPEGSELELGEDELDGSEDELQEIQGPGRPPARGGGTGGGGDGAGGPGRPSGAPLRGGNRVVGFLSASWAELQRVQWPDRRQVTQATAVVLGFVAIAGAYLGLADYVAKELVEFVL